MPFGSTGGLLNRAHTNSETYTQETQAHSLVVLVYCVYVSLFGCAQFG